MKTRCPRIAAAAFVLVLFSATGCAQKDPVAAHASSPGQSMPDNAVATSSPTAAASAAPDIAFARWSDISDDTYDKRPHFLAGLKRLVAKVDGQVAELKAKRAAMKSDTADWDFAMKEMLVSQAYLASVQDEVIKATADTWEQEKNRAGEAWTRTQDAYDKVKRSTTG